MMHSFRESEHIESPGHGGAGVPREARMGEGVNCRGRQSVSERAGG